MGKKVISTTTAALDGQSKPNHITMIGAMPTEAKGRDEIADGQRAALQERRAVDGDGDEQAREIADDVAGEHGLEEGLLEVGPEHAGVGGDRAPRWPRARAG